MKTQWMRRALCLVLVLCMTLTMLLSCSSGKGKTLMRLGDTTLSVNLYELMLSRMKGTLAYNDYEVDSDEFWDYIWNAEGATYNDYFLESIREAAKTTLVKLYLFEEVYDLTLPQSKIDEVDVYMADLLENDFDGSKTAFNQAMAAYGINMDMLRENYIMEAKIDYLSTYLSTRTADNAREEYCQQSYVCFRQILFPLYEYIYETDENGDVIYFKAGTNYIAYDKKGGVTKTGTDGTLRKDADGNTMYFTEDGKIAYDKANGIPLEVDEDKDGYADFAALSEEEQASIKEKAEQLKALIEAGDFTTFEQYGKELSGDDGVWDAYPGGIYLNQKTSYPIAYLNEISSELASMKVGDTLLHRSDNAYHFIMKYEMPKGAYADEENEDWFGSFESELMSSIIDTLCKEYIDQVKVDEDVFAEAMTMKDVGTNINY